MVNPGPGPILSVFHPGALGDGLLALPALRALRNKFPGHRIIWFGHKELGEVLVTAHEVHHAYSFDSPNFLGYGGISGYKRKMFSALFNRCKRAVGWMDDSEGIWRNWFKSIGVNDFILHSPHDSLLQHHHMVDRYLETLQPWFSTQQAFDRSETSFVDEHLHLPNQSERMKDYYSSEDPFIVLHPGSGSTYKCAPPALWAAIINELMVQPYRRICVVGGPADIDSLEKVQSLLTVTKPTILAGLNLISVGRYLQHAHLFIGHDSGLSHLAGRLGIPSILLFGPTDPAKWAPRGNHITVLQNSCHCVGKETIQQCKDKQCLSIPTKEIMAKAEEFLCGMNASISGRL